MYTFEQVVDAIHDSVARCGAITKQLLSFARHMDVSFQPVKLETIIRDVIGFLGKEAESAIRSLEPGQAILLKNVRELECEMEKATMEVHAQSDLVTRLAPMFDLYVNDAFAASHRSQCSLVGFQAKLPSAAGRLMERELTALASVFESPEKPSVCVLGGAKYSDAIALHSLQTVALHQLPWLDPNSFAAAIQFEYASGPTPYFSLLCSAPFLYTSTA